MLRTRSPPRKSSEDKVVSLSDTKAILMKDGNPRFAFAPLTFSPPSHYSDSSAFDETTDHSTRTEGYLDEKGKEEAASDDDCNDFILTVPCRLVQSTRGIMESNVLTTDKPRLLPRFSH